MILIKTTAPFIVDATALYNTTFVGQNTNLCAISSALSADYNLQFKKSSTTQSPNPVNALREYMQEIVLQGPNLDTQTLLIHINYVKSLPPTIVDGLVLEISNDFSTAGNMRSNPNDGSFLSKLANLLGDCNAPCNYFKPIGDVIGLLAAAAQMNTNSVSPMWDVGSQLLHAPLNIAGATLNKISTTAQSLVVGAAQSVKSIFNDGLVPLFKDTRALVETGLLRSGRSMSFTPHGELLATDAFPYFQTQANASTILAKARSTLMDCFRVHEFLYRYNPVDAGMNLSVASPVAFTFSTEGSTARVDMLGKMIIPNTKPAFYSIKEALDYKESNLTWDDSENWTRYPTSGKKSTTPSVSTPGSPANTAAANTRGTTVTDYGNPNDPYKDSASLNGVGAGGIGEPGNGPRDLQGGNYLLKDYSMAVSPDVQTKMASSGIQMGDWVTVNLSDGRQLTKRWDDLTAPDLTGRVDFYTPVGRAPALDASVVTIDKASGPPAGYQQPPRYINGNPVGIP